jgi:hypothetical protein
VHGAALGLFDGRWRLDRDFCRPLRGCRGNFHSTGREADRTLCPPTLYGKSQEEAPSEDEQAQASQTLEVKSPQEAYVAEVSRTRRIHGGFFL